MRAKAPKPVEPSPEAEEALPEEIPEIMEPEIPAEPELSHGEELPTEHVEHKKCPGCGIFVDLDEKVCPVCDTEFAVESPRKTTIEEEMANIEAERSADDQPLPKDSGQHIACPSCGADIEKGTKACPVCEYPLG